MPNWKYRSLMLRLLVVAAILAAFSFPFGLSTVIVTTRIDLPQAALQANFDSLRNEVNDFITGQDVRCIEKEFGGRCRFWDGGGSLGTVISYKFDESSDERYVFVRTEAGGHILFFSEKGLRDGSDVPKLHREVEQWLKSVWGIPLDLPVVRSVSGYGIRVEIK